MVYLILTSFTFRSRIPSQALTSVAIDFVFADSSIFTWVGGTLIGIYWKKLKPYYGMLRQKDIFENRCIYLYQYNLLNVVSLQQYGTHDSKTSDTKLQIIMNSYFPTFILLLLQCATSCWAIVSRNGYVKKKSNLAPMLFRHQLNMAHCLILY